MTDKSRLSDPCASRSQPRHLLEDNQNSDRRNKNVKATAEDEVEIANSLSTMNLSDSEESANQPLCVDDNLRDLMNDQQLP